MIELEGGARYLKQWSLNNRVILDGFPEGTRVEISKKYDCKDSALPVAAYAEGDHVYANIPNILMQDPGYIRIYVRPSAADPEHHAEIKDYRVTPAEKPEDYFYTETPLLTAEELEKRLRKLEEEGGTVKSDIEQMAKEKLDADKLPEAVNAALTQAKESGEFKGDPGAPGKTPEKGKDYFTDADKKEIAEQASQLVEFPKCDAVKSVNGVTPDENGNVTVSAMPNDLEQITILVDTDMLPAVHGSNGAILTDNSGRIILRY